jgi:hypothetical protein
MNNRKNVSGYSKRTLIIYLLRKIHFLQAIVDIKDNLTQEEINKAHDIAEDQLDKQFPALDASEIH